MSDKEPSPKTPSLRDRGSALLARFGWPRNRKTPLSSEYEQSIKILLLLALSLAIAVLLAPHPHKSLGDYKVGAIAQENIRAVGDYLVEDVETTQKRQRQILAVLPPVFDLDEQVADRIETRLHRGLEYMRKISRETTQELTQTQENNSIPAKPGFAELYPKLLQHKPEFDEILGTKIPTPTFQLLAKAEFSPALEALIDQVLEQVYRQGVIASRGLLQLNPKKIVLRHLPSGEEHLVQAPFSFLMAENLRKPMAN